MTTARADLPSGNVGSTSTDYREVTRTALQHTCSNARESWSGYRHTFGHGKGPAKCHYCKSAMYTTEGVYAVMEWRGDGRYSVSDARATYLTERAAEAKRKALDPSGDTLVVRFL